MDSLKRLNFSMLGGQIFPEGTSFNASPLPSPKKTLFGNI